jgi:TRAP-type mannitol/chloroaromatic compound transport system substrate-binding protein
VKGVAQVKKKTMLTLVCSVSLTLLVTTLLIPACAKPAAGPSPEVVEQELRAKIAELEENIAGMVPAPEVFEWRFTDVNPAGSDRSQNNKELAELIVKMSDGRIQITHYPAGELMPAAEISDGLCAGLTEFQHGAGGYFSGIVGEVGNMQDGILCYLEPHESFAMLNDNNRQVLGILRDAFAKHNVYYLAPCPLTPVSDCIYSNTPLESPADLKGLPFRASGLSAKMMSKLGAATVWLPWDELYTALQTGTVTACEWGPPAMMLDLGLQEVAKYWYLPYFSPGTADFRAVNMDSWQALPDDLKLIVEQACWSFWEKDGLSMYLPDLRMMAEIEAAGVEIGYWTDEEIQTFADAWGEVMAEMGASGDPYCAELFNAVKTYRTFLGKWPEK